MTITKPKNLKIILVVISTISVSILNAQGLKIIDERKDQIVCDSPSVFSKGSLYNYLLLTGKKFFKYQAVILRDTCISLNRLDKQNPYILSVSDVEQIEIFLKGDFKTESIKTNLTKKKSINPYKIVYKSFRQYIGAFEDSSSILFIVSFLSKKELNSKQNLFKRCSYDMLPGKRIGRNYVCAIRKNISNNRLELISLLKY